MCGRDSGDLILTWSLRRTSKRRADRSNHYRKQAKQFLPDSHKNVPFSLFCRALLFIRGGCELRAIGLRALRVGSANLIGAAGVKPLVTIELDGHFPIQAVEQIGSSIRIQSDERREP